MAEYVLLKQYCTSNQVLYVYVYMYYTALPSTPRYQICTSATLPTYNFWKIKNKFQSMQLCKYKYLHTKTVFQEKLIWRFENYNESKYKINPRRRKTFIPCLFKVLKSNQFQISSCCFFLPRKGICGKIQNLIKKTLIASSPTSLLKDILFSKEILASIISKCVFIYTFEIKVATKVWSNKLSFLILKAAKCNSCLLG